MKPLLSVATITYLLTLHRFSLSTSIRTSSNSSNSTCLSGNKTSRCPAWAYCNETAGICECYSRQNDNILVCNSTEKGNLIFSCYCLTYNKVNNMAELGACLYNCDYVRRNEFHNNFSYSIIPNNIHDLNRAMCKTYNRTGTLCGECLNDTFLRAYSYNMSCSSCDGRMYNWIKYIAVAYFPLTLFCLIVIACQINIPSSQILGYVFFCQILTSPIFARTILMYLHKKTEHSFTKAFGKVMGILYGVWNLDFFRFLDLNICLKLSPLATLSLDFFIAIYPLVIMIFIYILTLMYDSNWKIVVTIGRVLKVLIGKFNSLKSRDTSIINAFATFLFLSNAKFLNLCLDLLLPVQVCTIAMNGSCRWAVFNDPSINYFSHQHLPYAILGLVTFFVFVLTPMLILIPYPFSLCQKYLRVVFPQRWQIALQIFVDSFQGSLKDGTEKTNRDCRWFSVVPILLQMMIFIAYSATFVSRFLFGGILTMMMVLAAILTILVEPYKPQFGHYSNHFAVFLIFSACVFTSLEIVGYAALLTTFIYAAGGVTGIIHQVYLTVVVFYWFKKKK